MTELADRWTAIAKDLHKWSSPLKPSKEDTGLLSQEVGRWAQREGRDLVSAALLGVTQEITTNEWPIPVNLSAYDISPGMVELHGIQNARVVSEVRDWFTLGETGHVFDVVLGDGSFVFYGPEKAQLLVEVIDQILSPRGIYVGRNFVLPPPPTDFSALEVMAQFRAGSFQTIEELKFRVGMALQPGSALGIQLGIIEQHLAPYRDELLARYGAESVSTLDHYKDSQGQLYFPHWTQVTDLFRSRGFRVQAIFPSYDFGECCPTIVASRQ